MTSFIIINSQSLHLQILSHWELGLQHMNVGDIHSPYQSLVAMWREVQVAGRRPERRLLCSKSNDSKECYHTAQVTQESN